MPQACETKLGLCCGQLGFINLSWNSGNIIDADDDAGYVRLNSLPKIYNSLSSSGNKTLVVSFLPS